MKFVLNVPENWYRRYIVDCPDIVNVASIEDLSDEQWNKVIDTYMENIGKKRMENVLDVLSNPEFIDDGPRSSFIVESIYE